MLIKRNKDCEVYLDTKSPLPKDKIWIEPFKKIIPLIIIITNNNTISNDLKLI